MTLMRNTISLLLSLVLAFTPVISAQAAMIDNDTLLAGPATEHTRDSLAQFLDREQVRQQLQALGVSPEWAGERARSLTDAELERLNAGLDRMQAGSDSVLGVLLVIFIVFVITDAIGATDVFSFVHPVR